MTFDSRALQVPIVQAPMAGGPSTPALTAAVSGVGGLGFLAAGYKSAEQVAADIAAVREQTSAPFGVNVFSPPGDAAPPAVVSAFGASLGADAERHGVEVGAPRHDDDAYAGKLELLLAERVAVVSFTFGCPSRETVDALHAHGTAAWVSVTNVPEAEQATAAGADALVAQGTEAGGHRAYFRDGPEAEEYGLLVLLRLLAAHIELPLIASGGITDGAAIAAVLCAGAVAAQLGSALMLTPEAGTVPVYRERLAAPGPTRLTRAFSGRAARGIVNRFMEDHEADVPRAYPQVHHMTTPIRRAARAAGDGEAFNLWAGQGHELALERPAGELVRALGAEAGEVLARAAARMTLIVDG